MLLPRKDPFLNEGLEALNERFINAGCDPLAAYESLLPGELEFIDNEIDRCADFRYYVGNYHCIVSKSGGVQMLYPLKQAQERFLEILIQVEVEDPDGTVRLLILKGRQMGLCLSPETKVLTADLRWVPIHDVTLGQELVSVDENSIGGRGRGRKMRTGVAVAKRAVREPAFRLRMEGGSTLVATGQHRFLSKARGGSETCWRSVLETRTGDEIRYVTKPWGGSDFDDGWFGGLVDGEGSLAYQGKTDTGAQLSVCQVMNDVYREAESYLLSRNYSVRYEINKRRFAFGNPKWMAQQVHQLCVGRMNEVFRLVGQTRPKRFVHTHWWDGKDLPGKNSGIGWSKVISIEHLPVQDMVDLQTTTGTFIAEGFVSHNSTICTARTFHWTVFHEAQNTLVVAQDIGQADYLFEMSRFAHDNLPWWMRPEVRYDQKGRYLVFDRKDEQQRLMNPGLRSQIIVAAANQPQGVAVGKGLTVVHGSELASWKNGAILAEQLLPAVEGPGSKGLMEFTARGRGNFSHRLWKAAEAGEISWSPLFIPAYIEKTYSIPIRQTESFQLTEEERKTKENVFADTGEVISDEHFKWRRVKEAESSTLTSEESLDQEYPCTSEVAFQATGLSAFNKRKLMEMLKTTCRNPVYYGEIDLQQDEQVMPAVRYLPAPHITLRPVGRDESRLPGQKEFGSRFYVWEKPERGRDYYLAGDPAMGIPGGAFSCAEVLKIGRGPEPDVQVAEWHGWMDPEPFARVLAALGYWYNEAQVSIEMNNECGGSCHTEFTKMLQYPNWFQWQRTDTLITKPTNYLGWVTNDRTRRELISKTRTRINEGTVVLRSKPLVDQLLNFARDDGGRRYEDQEGSGDRAMALMVCILCAHISDWALEAAMKPPPPGTYRCTQCRAEYTGDKTREDKAGVRVCPNGHPVELIFVDETNTVRFPGDMDTESELRHISGEDKVPADVILWEHTGSREPVSGQGLPLREGELWKTF